MRLPDEVKTDLPYKIQYKILQHIKKHMYYEIIVQ